MISRILPGFELSPGARHSPGRRILGILLTYILPGVCLVWVFHDIRWREFLTHLTELRWTLVVFAVGADVAGYLLQGVRWKLLLRPVGHLKWLKATQAIYAGLFANEILPMRAGEMVRAYMVSGWLNVGFARVLPSMAIERLLDGIWLTLGIGIVALFVRLPTILSQAVQILGAIVIALFLLFVVLIAVTPKPRPGNGAVPAGQGVSGEGQVEAGSAGAGRRVRRFLSTAASAIGEVGFGSSFLLSAVASLGLLLSQALGFWLLIRAYGIPLSPWAGAAVMLLVHLGTAVPNAPANVGTYQFVCVVGLQLFAVEKTQAAALAMLIFLVLTVPLWLLGWLAVSRAAGRSA